MKFSILSLVALLALVVSASPISVSNTISGSVTAKDSASMIETASYPNRPCNKHWPSGFPPYAPEWALRYEWYENGGSGELKEIFYGPRELPFGGRVQTRITTRDCKVTLTEVW